MASDVATNICEAEYLRIQSRFIEEAILAWDDYREHAEGRLVSYEDYLRGYVGGKWYTFNRPMECIETCLATVSVN